MKVRCFDIDWDTSNGTGESSPTAAECGLPSETIMEMDDDTDVEEEGTDYLSDEFGYCVFGFNFEILEE
jgi:hypothetical protein